MFLAKSVPPAGTTTPRRVCIGSWARATVSALGADRWRIRYVRFVLDGDQVRIDRSSPYQAVLTREHLSRREARLQAFVTMQDGRRELLVRSLRRC